jgi:hypothetical protein
MVITLSNERLKIWQLEIYKLGRQVRTGFIITSAFRLMPFAYLNAFGRKKRMKRCKLK